MKKLIEWAWVLLIFAAVNFTGNLIGNPQAELSASFAGMLILLTVTLAGMALAELLPLKLPAIAYITLIAVVLSLPQTPGSAYVIHATGQISLLSITTPILAYAGISIGRNWTDFTKLGWRALLVASLVFLGTYLGSALIAECVLRLQG